MSKLGHLIMEAKDLVNFDQIVDISKVPQSYNKTSQ
jgi:hypothetical protein